MAMNAVRLFPQNTDLKGDLCQVRFRQGRYEEGIDLAREVLATSPRLASVRDMMGCCLFRLGRVDETLAALEEAARDPNHSPHNLGWANFNLGRLDEAHAAYEAANRIDPRNACSLRLLGMIEARRGRFAKALMFLGQSIDGFPRDGVPHYNLAVFHEERGEMQEAIRNFAESYRLAARGGPHWRLLNLLRSRDVEKLDLGVLADLLADLEKSASLPGKVQEKQLLARVLLIRDGGADDCRRALNLARDAIEKAKRPYPELLATLADAQYAAGEKTAAVRSLESALRLPHATKGMADQIERWRREIPAVLEADEQNPQPRLELVRAARREGKFAAALSISIEGLLNFPTAAEFLEELALLWGQVSAPVESELDWFATKSAEKGKDDAAARAGELRALLRQLKDRGSVRINCGGEGYTDRDSKTWLADAFFQSGWHIGYFVMDYLTVVSPYWISMNNFPFQGSIGGTEDVQPYRTERWFHPAPRQSVNLHNRDIKKGVLS